MKLTLLLDLDGTLLTNEVDAFLPGYLQAWSEFIAPYIEPSRFTKALLDSTRFISDHPRPDCTLRELFDSVFFPSIGIDQAKFLPLEEQFYARIFPTLKKFTQTIPGVGDLVNQAFERGYQVVIATNPFFPMTAIEQRLDWAGLPLYQYPFTLVTGMEDFHFGKPHPAYFAEILAHLGWPDGSVIMVGDDLEKDIIPADQLGIPTYWVDNNGKAASDHLVMPHAHGNLNDLINWLDESDEGIFQPDFSTSAAILATLRSTPAVLSSVSRLLTPSQWTCHPQADEWCPSEIVCHLRDVDLEVNIPRLRKIILEDNPFLPGMDTDRWNEERQYHYQDGLEALQSFISARMSLLSLLAAVQPEGWQRTARHSIFGRTDLAELTSFIAGHDRMHIQQFLQDLKPT